MSRRPDWPPRAASAATWSTTQSIAGLAPSSMIAASNGPSSSRSSDVAFIDLLEDETALLVGDARHVQHAVSAHHATGGDCRGLFGRVAGGVHENRMPGCGQLPRDRTLSGPIPSILSAMESNARPTMRRMLGRTAICARFGCLDAHAANLVGRQIAVLRRTDCIRESARLSARPRLPCSRRARPGRCCLSGLGTAG